MRVRNLFVLLLLFLVNLFTVSAVDPFEPLFGVTSLADLYAFAPGFIDSILYLVFFISLSLFALTKFYRDKWGEVNKQGKAVAVVLGIALAIAASIWSTTNDFSLASLSFLAALVFLGFIFLFLHHILKMFLGRNAKFATYIIIYFIAFLTFPAFGEWLAENANWLMIILSLLFLISLIALIVAFLRGFGFGGSRSSGGGGFGRDLDHDEPDEPISDRRGRGEEPVRESEVRDEDLNIDRELSDEGETPETIEESGEPDESGTGEERGTDTLDNEGEGEGASETLEESEPEEVRETKDELSDLQKLLNKSLRIPTKYKLQSLNIGQFASDLIFSKPPKLGRELTNRIIPIIEHLENLMSKLIRENYPRTHSAKFKEFKDSYDKIKKAEPRIKNLKKIIGGMKQAENDRTIIRYAKGAYLDIKSVIKVNKLKTLDKQLDLVFKRGYSNSKQLNKFVWKTIGVQNSDKFKEFLSSSDKDRKIVIGEIRKKLENMDVLEKEFSRLYEDMEEVQEINLISGRTWKKLFQNPRKLSFIMENANRFSTNRISMLFKFFNIAYKGVLNLDIELRNMKKIIKEIKRDF